jgi:hypothetical protein
MCDDRHSRQVTLSQKYQHLYKAVLQNLPNLWHSLEFDGEYSTSKRNKYDIR